MRSRFSSAVRSLVFGTVVVALLTPSTAGAATFGKTTVGALAGNGGFSANVKRCTKYTLSATGDVSKLTLYTGGAPGFSGNQVIRGVIYATSGGVPTTRLAVSNQRTVNATDAMAWRDLVLPATVRLTPGTYCLGVHSGLAEGVAWYRYDSVAGSWHKNSDVYADGASNPFGTAETGDQQISIYATYTVPPTQQCDATLNTGEALSAFLTRLPANGHGCIPGGTYSTSAQGSSLSNFKNGQVLKAKLDPVTGKAQVVTLQGSVWTQDGTTDVAFEDLTFQGRGDKAFVVYLDGDRTRLSYTTVTASPPSPAPRNSQQGIHIGSAAAGWKIERSKIHRNGVDTFLQHGIYCESARGGTVEGNWLYDNSAWAFHLYPDCDDVVLRYNVADENGRGITFSGEGALHSDRNTLQNGILSNPTGTHPPSTALSIACYLPGVGNAVRDMDVIPSNEDDCGSAITRSGIISQDPLYVNRAARDYRLQANSPARPLMGAFADAVPGPRT